jgi:hypothetical protein
MVFFFWHSVKFLRLIFDSIHQDSRLKIITFFCHIQYLKNLIFVCFRKTFFKSRLLSSSCFSVRIKQGEYMAWRMHTKHDEGKSAKVRVKSDKNITFLSITPTYQSVTHLITVIAVIMVTLVNKVATDFLIMTFNVVLNVLIDEPCLRRRSAAALLLGPWVRIPLRVWMSVSSECCVFSGRGLCNRRIASPEESYRLWSVWVWPRDINNEETHVN